MSLSLSYCGKQERLGLAIGHINEELRIRNCVSLPQIEKALPSVCKKVADKLDIRFVKNNNDCIFYDRNITTPYAINNIKKGQVYEL